MFFFLNVNIGKGDLVGCDISMHLLANSNGQGGNSQHNNSGQDVVVKSSSDVKVRIFTIQWNKTNSFIFRNALKR